MKLLGTFAQRPSVAGLGVWQIYTLFSVALRILSAALTRHLQPKWAKVPFVAAACALAILPAISQAASIGSYHRFQGPASKAPIVSACSAASSLEPGEQKTIGEILVVGNKTLNAAPIIVVTTHKVGDPCTGEVLNDMRERLVRSGYFGMRHPEHRDKWVSLQAEDVGDKCNVTITVDENDRIEGITMTGMGPIAVEQVKALLTPAAVFNPAQFAVDTQRITELYNRHGYSITFDKGAGMDPMKKGNLVIPIIVQRVEKIVVKKDNIEVSDARLLRELLTKPGNYLNRKDFYERDRQRLISKNKKRYEDVSFTETSIAPGQVRLQIHLKTKNRSSGTSRGAAGRPAAVSGCSS